MSHSISAGCCFADCSFVLIRFKTENICFCCYHFFYVAPQLWFDLKIKNEASTCKMRLRRRLSTDRTADSGFSSLCARPSSKCISYSRRIGVKFSLYFGELNTGFGNLFSVIVFPGGCVVVFALHSVRFGIFPH